jgi:PAS domain S-box-containing protein
MLEDCEEVAQFGSWEWVLATDALTWSAEHYRILGVSPEEFHATYQAFLEQVHPDDRASLQKGLEAAIRERQSFSMDFRIVRPDGNVRVLHAEGEVFLAARAEPVRMVGTAQDITQRRQAEDELEAARVRIFEAEVEKKRFTREVLRAITNGKLQLVDADDVPTEGQVVAEFSLAEPESYPLLRRRLKEVAQGAGMPAEHVDNLVLAAGEAVTNTIKHAREGRATISLDAERVIVRITDAGPGIHPDNLPATVLQAGYSTKVSLGMGFTLILDLGDCVWLATGPEGTIVQVANWIHPARHEGGLLEAVLERF